MAVRRPGLAGSLSDRGARVVATPEERQCSPNDQDDASKNSVHAHFPLPRATALKPTAIRQASGDHRLGTKTINQRQGPASDAGAVRCIENELLAKAPGLNPRSPLLKPLKPIPEG